MTAASPSPTPIRPPTFVLTPSPLPLPPFQAHPLTSPGAPPTAAPPPPRPRLGMIASGFRRLPRSTRAPALTLAPSSAPGPSMPPPTTASSSLSGCPIPSSPALTGSLSRRISTIRSSSPPPSPTTPPAASRPSPSPSRPCPTSWSARPSLPPAPSSAGPSISRGRSPIPEPPPQPPLGSIASTSPPMAS